MEVYSCSTGALVSTLDGPQGLNYYYAGFDAYTGYFLWTNLNGIIDGDYTNTMINVDTNEKRYVVMYPAGFVQLVNGYIIDGDGYYFKALP